MRYTIFSVLVLAVVMAAATPSGGIQGGEQLGGMGKPDNSVAMMASSGMMSMRSGGWSEEQPADDEIQALVDRVRPDVGNQLGKNLNVYEAKKYTYQVVSGFMYIIKVHVGNDEYIHVKIWEKAWENFYNLEGVQKGKKLEDPMETDADAWTLEDNFEVLEDNRKGDCGGLTDKYPTDYCGKVKETGECESMDEIKIKYCVKTCLDHRICELLNNLRPK